MTTTPTLHYGFPKPQVGADRNLWGTELNSALDLIDTAIFSLSGGNVTVLTYGADPTNTIDSSVAFNLAIDAVNAAGGGEVVVPKGDYKLTAKLHNLGAGTRIRGVGYGSNLVFGGLGNDYSITMSAVSYAGVQDLRISGTSAVGVYMTLSTNCYVKNCYITGCTSRGTNSYGTGVSMQGCIGCMVINNVFTGNGDGSTIVASYSDIQTNGYGLGITDGCKIIGNRCLSTGVQFNIFCFDLSRAVISWNEVTGALCIGTNNSGYGIMIYRTITYGLGTTFGNVVECNWVHDVQGTGIYIKENQKTRVAHNYIDTAATVQTDGTLNVGGIAFNNSINCSAIDNDIWDSGRTGISITSGSHRTITEANRIYNPVAIGIELRGSSTGLRIINNSVYGALGGISSGPYNDTYTHALIADNYIFGGQGSDPAIFLGGASKVKIRDNHCDTNPTYAIQLVSCSYCIVNGNLIYACGTNGIDEQTGTSNDIEHNKIIDGATAAPGTYDGIVARSPSCKVNNNHIINTLGVTNGFSIGIVITSAVTHGQCILNRVYGQTSTTAVSIGSLTVGIQFGLNHSSVSGNALELGSQVALAGDPTSGSLVFRYGTKASKTVNESGAIFSSGSQYVTKNAFQTTVGVDSWTANDSTLPSSITVWGADGSTKFYTAAAGTAVGNFATFWGTPYLTISVTGDITIGASGTKIGYYGGATAARPTITGSKGGNAALASLLTALAANGQVTDTTT